MKKKTASVLILSEWQVSGSGHYAISVMEENERKGQRVAVLIKRFLLLLSLFARKSIRLPTYQPTYLRILAG
jgi:hypothetical protein